MNFEKSMRFTSKIYDAVLIPESWDGILDEFTELIGAGAAALQVLDERYTENKFDSLSKRFREDSDYEKSIQFYFDNVWQDDALGYEYVFKNHEKGFISDLEAFGKTQEELENHYPSIWTRDTFGMFYRVAGRLNSTHAWHDHITFQYIDNRGPVTRKELDYANLFIPHFAKSVELGRKFAILKARFNALLGALDHYLIGTIITTQNGIILLANAEADRIFDRKDGLAKDDQGRISLPDGNSAELLSLIAKASATANGEGMDTEQIMSITRRSGLDSYVLSICPLRDAENTLENNFRGAIIYVTDPSNRAIISTDGIAKLYGLTQAEDDICSLLVSGMTTLEIAETRSVQLETVRSQIKRVLNKTQVKTRIQLIKLALSINLPIDKIPEVVDKL